MVILYEPRNESGLYELKDTLKLDNCKQEYVDAEWKVLVYVSLSERLRTNPSQGMTGLGAPPGHLPNPFRAHTVNSYQKSLN